MEQHSEFFIGLDTSKLKISVAIADGERTGEVRFFGDISSDPGAVASMVAKLAKGGAPRRFCHEAGPTGYDLCRQIIDLGHECVVSAKSSPRVGIMLPDRRLRFENPARLEFRQR